MNPEIEELYSKLRTANIAVVELERAIGGYQRNCEHIRTPNDPNWCQECGGPIPVDYESSGDRSE